MNPAASTEAWLPSLPIPGTLLFSSFFVLQSFFFSLLLHIPASPFNFGGVACRMLFTPNTNTQKDDGKGIHVFQRKETVGFRRKPAIVRRIEFETRNSILCWADERVRRTRPVPTRLWAEETSNHEYVRADERESWLLSRNSSRDRVRKIRFVW